MPGISYGQFRHPYLQDSPGAPYPSSGLPIIDVLRDVVRIDDAASKGLPPLSWVTEGQIPPGIFIDREAQYYRDNPLLDEDGQRLDLTDVTWAFNQATGARAEPFEVAPDSPDAQPFAEDPATQRRIYSINPALPSLNRQPGIIFVPAGIFQILGTVTLYSGQQIIGVGDLGSKVPAGRQQGSVLVKVGDGACIRTQSQLDIASDMYRSTTDIEAYVSAFPDTGMAAIDAYVEEWKRRLGITDDPNPDEAQLAARRLLDVWKRMLEEEVFHASAEVRIESVYIRQHDLGPFRAAAPIEDALADITLPGATLGGAGAIRDQPVPYSSMAIDLVRAGFSVIQDVTIRDFRQGVGLRIRAGGPGGFNSYATQLRRCDIGACHRGILAQPVIGPKIVGDDGNGYTITDFASDAPTAFSFEECHVHGYGRAGVELWVDTMWMALCRISRATADAQYDAVEVREKNNAGVHPCVALAGSANMIFRCSLSNDPGDTHVLMAPAPLVTLAEDDVAIQRTYYGAVSRQDSGASGSNGVVHCDFTDVAGNETPPAVHVLEFIADCPRPILRPAWDHSGTGPVNAPVVELTGHALSPETFWTSRNLLQNVDFEPTPGAARSPRADWQNAPALWRWVVEDPRVLPDAASSGQDKQGDPPGFVGPIYRVTFPDGAPDRAIRLEYVVVPALPDVQHGDANELAEAYQDAWAGRTLVQGKRLVGSCWVRATYNAAVEVRFREGEEAFIERRQRDCVNLRSGEWIQISTWLDPYRQMYAEEPSRETFEVAFCIVFRPPNPQNPLSGVPEGDDKAVILVGGPAVMLGPELFPVGPPRITGDGSALQGAWTLMRGFASTLSLRNEKQAVAAAVIGTKARFEAMEVCVDPSAQRRGVYRLAVERPNGTTKLAEGSLADFEAGSLGGLLSEVEFDRGDVVTWTRLDGPALPVEVLLRLRNCSRRL